MVSITQLRAHLVTLPIKVSPSESGKHSRRALPTKVGIRGALCGRDDAVHARSHSRAQPHQRILNHHTPVYGDKRGANMEEAGSSCLGTAAKLGWHRAMFVVRITPSGCHPDECD